jgi:hypothetical protein
MAPPIERRGEKKERRLALVGATLGFPAWPKAVEVTLITDEVGCRIIVIGTGQIQVA